MNNEELQRKYEISLWTLQDSFITVLKPSGLKWEGQGLDPHLVIKDDGDRTLSFKIPMYLRRNGEFVENPIWHNTRNGVLMVNLRKLKVIFNKGTADEAVFELVITKVTESHEGFEKYCEVEAEGLAFHELGKQGYTITLSGQADVDYDFPEGEYENRINYWCDKVLENSTWTYSVQMDWSSEDGVIDDISKPYSQLTQKERDELNAAREAKGLRRRDKIYEDSYVSSWKYNANRDAIVPTEVVDQKEKFRLGTDVQSKVLAFAFGLSAELSKSLLQARVRESLARLKANGKKLGRPFGAKSRELKLTKYHDKLERMIKRGISKPQIAKKLGVHKCTIYNYLKEIRQSADY